MITDQNPGVSPGHYAERPARRAYTSYAADFAEGRTTPRALLEEAIAVIEAREEEVQAFCHLDLAGARLAADAASARWREGAPLSPLDGCVVGMKDTLDVRGMPSRMNSALFDDSPKPYDSAASLALRDAGAVIIGKTWVPELALGTPPPTRNPWDARRTAGGSSSGSGAAPGAGMAPVCIGNQTGGSLVRPCSFSGTYGLKPSHGVLNTGGMHPIALSQDHIGAMAGTLADCWATTWELAERAGSHGGVPGLAGGGGMPPARKPVRLCRLRTLGWRDLDDGSARAFETLLGRIADRGVSIMDAGNDDRVAYLEELLIEGDALSNSIIMYELRWPLRAYIETHGREVVSEILMARLERGLSMSPADYRAALAGREAIRRAVDAVGRDVDGFITLASSGPAPFADPSQAKGAGAHLATGSRAFLSPWSMVGGPSMSLPLMAVDGMPLGAQIMGLPGQDRQIVGLASWLDEPSLTA